MPIDFKYDTITEDLQLAENTGIPVEETRERDLLEQQLLFALNTWTGEWPLDTTYGIPYLSVLGQRSTSITSSLLESAIRRMFRQYFANIELRSLNIDFEGETRRFTVTIRARRGNEDIILENLTVV
jgi:hypothetical protein